MEEIISVIVPVYNVEKYLNKCVDSIVNQTYKNLEIILVDDGSPDNCPKICDEYAKKDNRIKVIHKENGGLSDARNKGIEVATGKYIGFVDSDDWIDKDMYKVLYENLTRYKADISCCDLIRVKDGNINNGQLKKFNSEIEVFDIDEYMKIFFKIDTQECVYYAVNKLYKRELIDKELYPKGLTSEDVEGTCKVLLKCKKIVNINYPYYYYYQNENSITGRKFSEKDLDLIKIWDHVVEICKESKSEYLEMAKFNRNRIDYTLLMRMALQLSYNEIVNDYYEIEKNLIQNLKNNKKQLLKSTIPFSRKITIILILLNYRWFVTICHAFK